MSSFDSSLVSSCPPLNYHSRAQNGGVAKGGAFLPYPRGSACLGGKVIGGDNH